MLRGKSPVPPPEAGLRPPYVVVEAKHYNHDWLDALGALAGTTEGCTAKSFEFNGGSSSVGCSSPWELVFEAEGCDPNRCGALGRKACGLVGREVSIVHELGKEVIEVDGRPVQTNPMVTRASAVVLRHSLFNEA